MCAACVWERNWLGCGVFVLLLSDKAANRVAIEDVNQSLCCLKPQLSGYFDTREHIAVFMWNWDCCVHTCVCVEVETMQCCCFFWFAVALCLNKGFFVPDMHEMLLECLCTVKEKCWFKVVITRTTRALPCYCSVASQFRTCLCLPCIHPSYRWCDNEVALCLCLITASPK